MNVLMFFYQNAENEIFRKRSESYYFLIIAVHIIYCKILYDVANHLHSKVNILLKGIFLGEKGSLAQSYWRKNIFIHRASKLGSSLLKIKSILLPKGETCLKKYY